MKIRVAPTFLGALAACLLPACERTERVDLLIRDATIVDVVSGETLAGRAVVVDDGLVEQIVPAAAASGYDPAVVVDAAGGFLLPALADAHVHIQSAGELDNYRRYGIALVVNMAGRPMHLAPTSRRRLPSRWPT